MQELLGKETCESVLNEWKNENDEEKLKSAAKGVLILLRRLGRAPTVFAVAPSYSSGQQVAS